MIFVIHFQRQPESITTPPKVSEGRGAWKDQIWWVTCCWWFKNLVYHQLSWHLTIYHGGFKNHSRWCADFGTINSIFHIMIVGLNANWNYQQKHSWKIGWGRWTSWTNTVIPKLVTLCYMSVILNRQVAALGMVSFPSSQFQPSRIHTIHIFECP